MRSKQILGKPEERDHGVTQVCMAFQDTLPAKVFGERLDEGRNVTQPERSPAAMVELMKTNQPKVVLSGEDSEAGRAKAFD